MTLCLDGESGGVEQTIGYLRKNREAIAARPAEAPVVLVIDWDSRSKEASAKSAFLTGSPGNVVVWPETALNPKLGRSFKGIERCYSQRLVKLAVGRGAEIAAKTDGTYMAEKDSYGATKQILSELVSKQLAKADLVHAEAFVIDLLRLTRP